MVDGSADSPPRGDPSGNGSEATEPRYDRLPQTWALNPPLSPAAFYVLGALANIMGKVGNECWPSVGKLALMTGYSRRTVQGAIRELATRKKADGKAVVLVVPGAGPGGANRYVLNLSPSRPPQPTAPPVQPTAPPPCSPPRPPRATDCTPPVQPTAPERDSVKETHIETQTETKGRKKVRRQPAALAAAQVPESLLAAIPEFGELWRRRMDAAKEKDRQPKPTAEQTQLDRLASLLDHPGAVAWIRRRLDDATMGGWQSVLPHALPKGPQEESGRDGRHNGRLRSSSRHVVTGPSEETRRLTAEAIAAERAARKGEQP